MAWTCPDTSPGDINGSRRARPDRARQGMRQKASASAAKSRTRGAEKCMMRSWGVQQHSGRGGI